MHLTPASLHTRPTLQSQRKYKDRWVFIKVVKRSRHFRPECIFLPSYSDGLYAPAHMVVFPTPHGKEGQGMQWPSQDMGIMTGHGIPCYDKIWVWQDMVCLAMAA